ncbi:MULTISPECIES: ABC transporter substrate-binding protein [unclassified Arthrobacter]|uniref:ABC transporter substrate-binding protein n=1 Tax=unclassified Arthrobacter TaxID=235627 RepID=UPI001C8595FA|nr:ABC transporter substrate-binding protein [Arthrobacter sp. MAHUQ-56]MBX7445942.1 ABC transporter substrate-binding protein [Arthrobacter sp. MAHUQ-56]
MEALIDRSARRRPGRTRRFVAAVGIAAMAATAALTGCSPSSESASASKTIKVLAPPDTSGTMQKLIDQYNKDHSGGTQIEWQTSQTDMSAYFDQLRTQFLANSVDADVVIGDVTWAAQLADSGWVEDLSDRFPKAEQDKFLKGGMTADSWKGKVYGVPWFNATAYLFYRKDLLAKHGFTAPPATWDELETQAKAVLASGDVTAGYLMQGAKYEGLVCNAAEFVWNAGGDILDPADSTKAVVNSLDATAGLAEMRKLVDSGIAPAASTTFKEQENYTQFFQGDALFMRNWSDFYRLVKDPSVSKLTADQVGVASLPVTKAGTKSSSTLGGWNLFMNASGKNKDAAWDVIQYFTSEQAQKIRAVDGGYLPTRASLYDDADVNKANPLTVIGKDAAFNARSRPVTPYYSDASLAMQDSFYKIISGAQPAAQGASELQTSLNKVVQAK